MSEMDFLVLRYYRCKLSFLIRKMILLCIKEYREKPQLIVNTINELSSMDDFELNSFESKVN